MIKLYKGKRFGSGRGGPGPGGAAHKGREHVLNGRRLLCVIAALAIAAGASRLIAGPEGPREISFYHIHTKETLTIVYKRDGRYIPEAMEKIDWIMRDWRQNKSTKMDPETIDILWEMHTELGSKEPIHIICGFRSSGTNEMLRRTVGGQAKNSQHITGKAIDVYFPDVPSKLVRYAGLIRERGGVGYYPTSALPFVHVDTGRVRHWPTIARDELALLFPSGHSKHIPIGGELTPADFKRARERRPDLAVEMAAYLDNHAHPKAPILVAAADLPVPPAPKPAARPAPKPAVRVPEPVVASLALPKPAPIAAPVAAREPKLVAAPRPVERPSRFLPRPSDTDRTNLDKLVTLASLEPAAPAAPRLLTQPAAVARPPAAKAAVAKATPPTPAAPEGATDPDPLAGILSADGWGTRTEWVKAPVYDDDHPDELSYQPFPIGPMLTATASPDDPALAQLVHPDIAKTLEVLDDDGSVQPMRFRPRQQVAELMWAQQFSGDAVNVSGLDGGATPATAGLTNRSVKTSAR